ncbi:unnamed protein product [Candidula unifasciata]|uniref:Uncharacterized protein n=1 Tax=Candidula unifasciata TaxID=100452 RepID=A0A8S3YHX7_9EUPU|nr:unnamed protein product [Candidula unifasciata]
MFVHKTVSNSNKMSTENKRRKRKRLTTLRTSSYIHHEYANTSATHPSPVLTSHLPRIWQFVARHVFKTTIIATSIAFSVLHKDVTSFLLSVTAFAIHRLLYSSVPP